MKKKANKWEQELDEIELRGWLCNSCSVGECGLLPIKDKTILKQFIKKVEDEAVLRTRLEKMNYEN